jgi:tetratricopeptide (TPR) repeat protein
VGVIKSPVLATKQEYSRAEVRRMLGVSERQLRNWERFGFIPGAPAFSFSDLIALRTLQRLRENRISTREIEKALLGLKKKLAGVERPLSELRIVSDGRRIAVQIAGQRMEAISGQMLFDFETSELSNLKSFPPAPKHSGAGQEKQSEFWFQRGLALEENEAPVEEAIAAYEKAIELNPGAAGALVNLGTIYYRLRKLGEAERFYKQAIEADSKYPLAYFNIGNLYDEEGNLEQARKHYMTAIKLNPVYADAHFNLALLCERAGDSMKAVHHWKSYLKLDSSSSWADIARRQLEKLRHATIIRSR